MTQTLTTDRQQFEAWVKFHSDEEECTNLLEKNNAGTNYLHPHTDLAWIAWKASRELLASREAQPVAWTSQRALDTKCKIVAFTDDMSAMEHGVANDWKDIVELYTAPPAPAVPACFLELLKHADGMAMGTDWNSGTAAKYHRKKLCEAVEACRAAMLAQPQNEPQNIPNNIPGDLADAVNRLLDCYGTRGHFSAIRCGDAREEVERLLAQPVSQGYKLVPVNRQNCPFCGRRQPEGGN
ncbi:hypothetical protein [Serratia sp. P2ACOL2]|uniref:hypothetical protein n=1 Tax=Serratia sp. P2ACOL2 TaxID=2482769 RepID=UPI000EFC7B01|nr:hypothetical protein [Serratia sp. P2ACOL2]AYO38513.1 hypothetical protein EBA31_14945 [Serratia sp. P2ACOL2]